MCTVNKVINAPTIEEMREGKEILANEIGVVFKPKGKRASTASSPLHHAAPALSRLVPSPCQGSAGPHSSDDRRCDSSGPPPSKAMRTPSFTSGFAMPRLPLAPIPATHWAGAA